MDEKKSTKQTENVSNAFGDAWLEPGKRKGEKRIARKRYHCYSICMMILKDLRLLGYS